MKILFTGFKGTHNTSFQLVSYIGKEAFYLTNSVQGLKRDIESIDQIFDMVIMFGVDKSLAHTIRIETCAENNGEIVYTDFQIDSLECICRKKSVPYTISYKPAGYLCNTAYYCMLQKNPNTVFIHIPSLKGMSPTLFEKLSNLFSEDYLYA